MLVLTRHIGEGITLAWGDEIVHLTILKDSSAGIRLGIDAPDTCQVYRDELLRTRETNQHAAHSTLTPTERDPAPPRLPIFVPDP